MLLLLGQGAIIQPATEFFCPIILSVPLALCMMGNNIIRAGKSWWSRWILPAAHENGNATTTSCHQW
jgi:hypothetical protein